MPFLGFNLCWYKNSDKLVPQSKMLLNVGFYEQAIFHPLCNARSRTTLILITKISMSISNPNQIPVSNPNHKNINDFHPTSLLHVTDDYSYSCHLSS